MYESLEEAFSVLEGTTAMKADDLDSCIIGIASRSGQPDLIVYDSDKIIDLLMERDGMEFSDAVDFFQFNIAGAWVGEGTPLFLTTIQGKTT